MVSQFELAALWLIGFTVVMSLIAWMWYLQCLTCRRHKFGVTEQGMVKNKWSQYDDNVTIYIELNMNLWIEDLL